MIPRAFHAVALALAVLCCACSSAYSISKQELFVRLLPQEDALVVLEVQTGLSAPPKEIDKAVLALTSVLNGARRFPPEQGFISFDLDRTVDESWTDTEKADFTEFVANVRVESVGLFRDDREQLCFARRTRIDHVRRTLEIANAVLNRELLEDRDRNPGQVSEFRPVFPIYDTTTRDALWAAAEKGHAWLTMRDDALVLDYPMSETNAARCMSAVTLGELHKDNALILSQASSMKVADGRVLLRFGEPHRAVMQFAVAKRDDDEPRVDEDLMTALQQQRVSIGSAAKLTGMRAVFEMAPASVPSAK